MATDKQCCLNISSTLLLHWHHVRIATLLQQCYNISQWIFLCNTVATLQRVNRIAFQQCLPAMSVQQCKALCVRWCTDIANHVVCNIACHSVQHCNNIATTLLLQWHHVCIATLLQWCYNIACGYFCATLRQRCSVSTKLRISNVSRQCCWDKSATLPTRCGSVNRLPGLLNL